VPTPGSETVQGTQQDIGASQAHILKAPFEQSRPVSDAAVHDAGVNEIKTISRKDPRQLDIVDNELGERGVSAVVASFPN